MSRLEPYLIRMLIFLGLVAALAGVLFPPLARAFFANAPLNGLILGVLLLGILYTLRQVWILRHEQDWVSAFMRQRAAAERGRPHPTPPAALPEPRLLAPMAKMMQERNASLRISATSMRSVLDSVASRLDESRSISRYLIGLLIFLGLLGTFWGLLQTINAVGDVIAEIDVGTDEPALMFGSLKEGLAAPLGGMGTAFSSSLFGLAGSLVVGFLDLQAGQAQNRFYNEFEDWLSGLTRLSAPQAQMGGAQSVPDYVEALLEHTAEGLDALQRTLTRGEEGRMTANAALIDLSEKLSTLTDQMKAEQSLLVRLAENQMALSPLLTRLADGLEQKGDALDEATKRHIRNMEVYLARLLEETSSGRHQSIEEVRSEIKLLARTLAAGLDRSTDKS